MGLMLVMHLLRQLGGSALDILIFEKTVSFTNHALVYFAMFSLYNEQFYIGQLHCN